MCIHTCISYVPLQRGKSSVSGRILSVPSVFGRLPSVFSRLQNSALLVASSKNGGFRRRSKPAS